MQALADYLAAVDGTNDWSVVGPLFDAAFDDEAVVVTADGEYSKAQWGAMAQNLVSKGATVSPLEVIDEEGDSSLYRITVSVGGETLVMTARATLRNGRILRVEPVDPTAYSDLVDRSH